MVCVFIWPLRGQINTQTIKAKRGHLFSVTPFDSGSQEMALEAAFGPIRLPKRFGIFRYKTLWKNLDFFPELRGGIYL
jgi:hypothetical protein